MRPGAVLAWAVAGALSLTLLAAPVLVDAASAAVSIRSFAFAPQIVTVSVGDTVQWTNNEGSAIFHTATADNGAFNSGVLGNGQSFAFRFSAAGEFTYHCSVHPSMRGSVMVIGAATPAPTAPPPPPPSPPSPTAPPPPITAPPPRTTPTPTAAQTAEPSPAGSPVAPPSASPSTSAGASPSIVSAASPSPAASAAPPPNEGAALLLGGAALAIVGLGGLAWWVLRRHLPSRT